MTSSIVFINWSNAIRAKKKRRNNRMTLQYTQFVWRCRFSLLVTATIAVLEVRGV